MGKKQPRQPVSGTATGRTAASPKALKASKGAQRGQAVARSAVTGRFLATGSSATVGIKKLKKAPGPTRTAKAPAKPTAPAVTPPASKAPATEVVLTGRSGLIGFFRSNRGDLSARAKDLARGRDGRSN